MALLGTIDTVEEALLIASTEGPGGEGGYDYYWYEGDLELGAYREIDDGYELVVVGLTTTCSPMGPIELRRWLLRVSSAGEITVIRSGLINYFYGVM